MVFETAALVTMAMVDADVVVPCPEMCPSPLGVTISNVVVSCVFVDFLVVFLVFLLVSVRQFCPAHS